MTPDETQKMHRDELLAQLTEHPKRRLRLWFFDYYRNGENPPAVELEFIEVKFEDDEIIVGMRDK